MGNCRIVHGDEMVGYSKQLWECTNELRWLERPSKEYVHSDESVELADKFLRLGADADAYEQTFPEKTKALLEEGKSLDSHVEMYCRSEVVYNRLYGNDQMSKEVETTTVLQQKWVSGTGEVEWRDVPTETNI